MSEKRNSYTKEKAQLLESLLEQGKKKGFIRADTIRKRFARYKPSENEKDEIFAAFENAGIDVIYEETSEAQVLNDDILAAYEDDETVEIPKPDSTSASLTDPMQLYMNEIHKYPTLTHKETIALVHKIKAGDSDAREYLINCNLKFAFTCAVKYARTGLPLFDLIQQANIGLIKAVDLYSANRGTKFTTYAVFWIRNSLLKYINANMRIIAVSPYIASEIGKLKTAREQYIERFHENPSDDDLASFTGLPIARIKYLNLMCYDFVSTEEQPDEEMDGTILNILSTDLLGEDPFFSFHLSECRRLLEPFLDKLSERERTVLCLRFGLMDDYLNQCYSLEEAGRMLGITKERVRQLEQRALQKLRKMPGIEALREYINL